MYLAGALHDIGKMAVGNEILEKPDKLTDDEFSKMKNQAGYTLSLIHISRHDNRGSAFCNSQTDDSRAPQRI